MPNFKAYIKVNFEKVDSPSKKQSCSRVLIKQLDLRRMILKLIAMLFIQKFASLSKISILT